jgi:hypothetical protein
MSELPILAKCIACGRGFVSLPSILPATDPFGPENVRYRKGDTVNPCGGEIELTDAGRRALAEKDQP